MSPSPESPGQDGPAATETEPTTSRLGPDDKTGELAARVTAKPVAPPPAARRAGRLFGKSVAKAKAAMASPAAREAGKKAASAAASRYFARAKGPVGKLVQSKDKLLALATRGDKAAGKIESGAMSRVSDELKTLLRLIRAYATGQYRDVPLQSMVLIVAAVVYVVSPLDLIPDFIPAVGGLDDLTVLTFALKVVREELDEFLAWERDRGPEAPLPPLALPPGEVEEGPSPDVR